MLVMGLLVIIAVSENLAWKKQSEIHVSWTEGMVTIMVKIFLIYGGS